MLTSQSILSVSRAPSPDPSVCLSFTQVSVSSTYFSARVLYKGLNLQLIIILGGQCVDACDATSRL